MTTHDTLAKLAAPSLDLTLDEDQAKLLRDMLGDDPDEASPLRLMVGEGHSGHGLYVAEAECQEEGANFIAEIPRALTAQAPAAAEPVACTYPSCKCPFDAPSDPNWCARGLPKPRPFSFGNDERAMLWKAYDDSPKHALDLAIRAIERLAAQQAAQAPEGWVLVPVEPTDKMLTAAARASMAHLIECINDPAKAKEVGSEEMCKETYASRYRSMLAARPQAEGA